MPTRRELILAGILAAGGAAGLALGPVGAGRRNSANGPKIAGQLPKQVAGWAGQTTVDAILPPDDGLTDQTYGEVVIRRFVDGRSPPITLVIAQDAVQGFASQLHRPETCYPASGFSIKRQESYELQAGGRNIPAGFLEAERGSRRDAVLYWTRLGDSFPQDIWQQRAAIIKGALTGFSTRGILVRLSQRAADASRDRGQLADFAAELLEYSSPELDAILLGTAS
ncbi:exosortase C-terminal domain/associated protein EpsI [Blastomonas aquatica]|uniref:Methanolan biosynthesis EpsI domain-containing protein n=1 Tax=Blastomonas aquatica TaxID=1510276 RepID=A0ABQ1JS77_9SPHN|nr:exosortase C-terminal domain/associated protein EpsI [Blastomonas aquatica]GGB75492.1 hypothetical protein GCM10010833_33400 [Blastomonas aquatica]